MPRKITIEKRGEILELKKSMSASQIASLIGVNKRTIERCKAENVSYSNSQGGTEDISSIISNMNLS